MELGRSIKKKFLREVDPRNRSFRPLRAALYVLQAESPEQRADIAEEKLRDWSRQLASQLARAAEPYQKFARLNTFFFQDLGFALSDAPLDRAGIDLHRVLDRRRGMGISLALVFHDLALRQGIPLQALSYPGHLLFTSAWLGRGQFLDPSDGLILGLDEARHRVELRGSKQLVLIKPEQLITVSDRQLLERYLVTLKGVYHAEGLLAESLQAANWRLLLSPDSLAARWERGLLLYELNRFRDAQRDLGNLLARGAAMRQDPRNLTRAQVCALLASVSGNSQ
jgi:regulator of sirC expression with transglutaminase-like and TPR domain